MRNSEIIPVDVSVFPTSEEREYVLKLLREAYRLRGKELQERIAFGVVLFKLKAAFKNHNSSWDETCRFYLEITEKEANYRIQLSSTWMALKGHFENDDNIDLPTFENHVTKLFPLPPERRGPAWAAYKKEMGDRRPTGPSIESFVEKFLALPADPQPDMFAAPAAATLPEEADGLEADLSSLDLPPGNGLPPENIPPPAATDAENHQRSTRAMEAIERIAGLCGEGFRDALLTKFRLTDKDIIAWAKESDENVVSISSMVMATNVGVTKAIRWVNKVIDDKTQLSELKSRALHLGGTFELDEPAYKTTVVFKGTVAGQP